jgi:hypothetical protein
MPVRPEEVAHSRPTERTKPAVGIPNGGLLTIELKWQTFPAIYLL